MTSPEPLLFLDVEHPSDSDQDAQRWAASVTAGTRVRFDVVVATNHPDTVLATVRFHGSKRELDLLAGNIGPAQPGPVQS